MKLIGSETGRLVGSWSGRGGSVLFGSAQVNRGDGTRTRAASGSRLIWLCFLEDAVFCACVGGEEIQLVPNCCFSFPCFSFPFVFLFPLDTVVVEVDGCQLS